MTAAELIGGRLVLTGFDGQVNALDPATGRGRRGLTAVAAPRRTDVDRRWITSADPAQYWWTTAVDRAPVAGP